MKITRFLINSHSIIALAAVSLTMATPVQLRLPLKTDALLALIFFATSFDYNLHSFMKAKNDQVALITKKIEWVLNNLRLVKILIFLSLTGLLATLFFVSMQVIYLFILLAIPTMLYSLINTDLWKARKIKGIPGVKIVLIAFVWSAVTIIAPVLDSVSEYNPMDFLALFIERFTFIFAIAIPFDIRDLHTDMRAGIKTIPNAVGEYRAILICNFVLAFSMIVALVHYSTSHMNFILPAYCASIIVTFVLINSKHLRRSSPYYYGLLDGSIILHGILIYLSFYLGS